jgi:hypothetical protein
VVWSKEKVTQLDGKAFSAAQIRALGHDRWKNENNGWNDLTQNWALKHGFLHACKHRPMARTADGTVETIDGTPQLTPNHGLAAVVLILCIAFALSSAFALVHSKIMRLRPMILREEDVAPVSLSAARHLREASPAPLRVHFPGLRISSSRANCPKPLLLRPLTLSSSHAKFLLCIRPP